MDLIVSMLLDNLDHPSFAGLEAESHQLSLKGCGITPLDVKIIQHPLIHCNRKIRDFSSQTW